MKRIRLIIYGLVFLCASKTYAQTFINQGCYWPYFAPNGTARPSRDSTSEDWWYDVKTIPENHPSFVDSTRRYIACGYSQFDDIGLGNLYTNDPCRKFTEIDFNASFGIGGFELPDMRHMNTTGTIGLVNLTRTSSASNPYVWIYNYGLGSNFTKVILTTDGGFLATGSSYAFNLPYPSSEPQFANFQTSGNAPQPILYQSPSAIPGNPHETHAMQLLACPPKDTHSPAWEAGSPNKYHAALVKVDQNGILEWYYTYGIVPFNNIDTGEVAYRNSSIGTDIVETNDGYILSGILHNSPSNNNLSNHGFLLKTNSSGILQWINEYVDTFLSNKFTSILLKDTATLYVTGERTNMTIGIGGNFCGSFPNGSPCLNSTSNATLEHHNNMRYLPFVKKIDLVTKNQVWDLPLETDSSIDYRVRNIALDEAGKLLIPVSSVCTVFSANGECKESYVVKVSDNITYASLGTKVDFGPIRAFDLATGLGVTALTDGGFIVMGTKKTYNIPINKNYSQSPFGNGYNMSGFAQSYAQTDAFIAKCSNTGNIEWTTIFDNKSISPGGNPLTTAGDPRNPSNLDNWMNYTTTRSKKDIKRQECLYSIATSVDGEIIVGGNMSGNIDDSYIAMVENSCNLTLSNHLIHAIPSIKDAAVLITNMDKFIASNIYTGRPPWNTNDVATFEVSDKAVIEMIAGQEVVLYEGTDLETGTDVNIYTNSLHTCTGGPIYSNSGNIPGNRSARSFIYKNLEPRKTAPKKGIAPNPTSSWIVANHPSETKTIQVADMYGKIILNIKNNGSTQTRLDLTRLPAGIYFIHFSGSGESIKVVKL